MKLAAELAGQATGRTIYILDEPTSGLHFADIEQLLQVLIIEHQLDVVKCADYVIDLGPEGGEGAVRLWPKIRPSLSRQAADQPYRPVFEGSVAGYSRMTG